MSDPSDEPASKQIPWPRIFAEGGVIVASILLALAADAWWDERQDLADEREIIGRLISDVQADIAGVEFTLNRLPLKEASLLRVDSVLRRATTPQDAVSFLSDVIDGANFGWNQYVPRSVTFDELLGSGTFGLIRDSSLRDQLSNYYRGQEGVSMRIDERETDYPSLSYQLAPRSTEFNLASTLSQAEARQLAGRVFETLSSAQITAELNLAQFIGQMFNEWSDEAGALLARLETYRSVIE